MLTTLIVVSGIAVGLLGISIATWSILRTRSILRAHQQNDQIERTANKLYLVVMDMLARVSPDRLSPENIQSYKNLPDETKDLYRDLAKRYFEEAE